MKKKVYDECNYISAFITMRCNLDCGFCLNAFSKSFNRKGFREISGEMWVQALNNLESPNVPVTFSGGEPFLHKDFIYIINHLKPELNIDILTNLYTDESRLERFLKEVNPERIKRNSPYASMRVSYHPEQMDASRLVKNVKMFKDAGFSIGIWSVLYPSPKQLASIVEMQFRCKSEGIEFRLKDFTGTYKGQVYGNYSKYPDSIDSEKTKKCLCRTSELLMGPSGDVYKCHRDLYAEENSIGNISDDDFQIQYSFRECKEYGHCHPCDVKVKTNYKQELGHTSVEIK